MPGPGRAAGSSPADRYGNLDEEGQPGSTASCKAEMAPAGLFIWKESGVGRGKGSQTLGNLKPRVNPGFCIKVQHKGFYTYSLPKSLLWGRESTSACLSFQGQPEAKPDLGLIS